MIRVIIKEVIDGGRRIVANQKMEEKDAQELMELVVSKLFPNISNDEVLEKVSQKFKEISENMVVTIKNSSDEHNYVGLTLFKVVED